MPERSFGRTIRYRRTKLGLSQAKLGELVGRAATTIRSWERDQSHPTDPNVISALAAVLAVDEQMLFERAGVAMPEVETSPTMEESLATLNPEPEAESSAISLAFEEDDDIQDFEGGVSESPAVSEPDAGSVESSPDSAATSEESAVPEVVGYVAPPEAYAITAPTPTVGELSYIEDASQRQLYRMRTMATVIGVAALAIAFIWALGEGFGALGAWWDAFVGNLRL